MAQRATSAIITCAPTGAIHTPTMSPALPITPEQIAQAALGAAAAGAAIVHLHVRDPEDGRPIQDPGLFKEVLAIVKDRSDVVVNLTTGGSPHMTVDERIAPAVELAPELASLNMGSMNFGLFPMLDRYPTFQHEWERAHLANKVVVFKNTYADIERILKLCGDQGTRFEFECYDTAHLYNLANMLDRGLVRPPLFVQTVFGLLVQGHYRPGERIVEFQLAKELGLSQSPVREGLRELAAVGIVTIHPRRGARVRMPSAKELADVSVVRAEVDALAARLTAGRIPDETLDALDDLIAEMLAALARGDFSGVTDAARTHQLAVADLLRTHFLAATEDDAAS